MKPLFSVHLGRKVVEVLSVPTFYCLLLFHLLLGECWGASQERIKRTEYAEGTSERTLYDAEGRREYSYDRRGMGMQTVYDALGRVWKSTDARNNTTTYIYDDAGRRTAVRDALQRSTSSEYDDLGNLRFFTDAKLQVTEHIYDTLNRRVRTIFPATEVWNGSAYVVQEQRWGSGVNGTKIRGN